MASTQVNRSDHFVFETAMTLGFLALAFSIECSAAREAVASVGVLAVRPTVILSPGQENAALRLSDVVDLGTVPNERRQEVTRHLEAIELTDRPALGEERSFSSEGLMDVVSEANRRFSTAGIAIEWKVPPRMVVRTQFSREIAQAVLIAELKKLCDRCEVRMSRVDWPVIDWREVRSWSVKPLATRPRGSFAIGVEVTGLNGRAKSVVVSGTAGFTQEVPVLNRAVNPGEKISENDIQFNVRDVTYATDTGASRQDLERSAVTRGMAAGDVLWKGALRPEVAIQFGDPVRIAVTGETWIVSTEGVSQSTGAVGDAVKVKVTRTQKLVSGILKEKGLVEIQ